MNQINIEDVLRVRIEPMDSAGGVEGNKQGASAYAIYLAVIDD